MLWVHPGALLAVEGLCELLRVGQHADHAEARGAVGVVKDLRDDEKNQKLAVSCNSTGNIGFCDYRASQLVVDLGWVEFDLRVPPSGPTAVPHLPIPISQGRVWQTGGNSKSNQPNPSL